MQNEEILINSEIPPRIKKSVLTHLAKIRMLLSMKLSVKDGGMYFESDQWDILLPTQIFKGTGKKK